MADTPVQFEFAAGETLTVELHDISDAVTANSPYAAAEESNRHGLYEITVDDAVTGLHRLNILSSGVSVGSAWVNITANGTTVYVASRDRAVLATDTSGNALATATTVSTISTNVSTLLTRIPATLFNGITSLASWLGIIAGKTADASTLAEVNATTAGAGYDNATDSLEGIADNAGGGSLTAQQVANAVHGRAPTSGTPASGSIGAELDALGQTVWAYSSRTLTGGTSTVVSPIDSQDNLTIYEGVDYNTTIGTGLSWSKSGYPAAAWESGATGTFRYRLVGSATTVEAGTVALAHDGDSTMTATLAMTDTETVEITGAGDYEIEVETSGGLKRVFAYGSISHLDRVEDS